MSTKPLRCEKKTLSRRYEDGAAWGVAQRQGSGRCVYRPKRKGRRKEMAKKIAKRADEIIRNRGQT